MTWTSSDIFGFSVLSTILVIMVLGIVFSFFTPTLDRWSKRYFITLFSLLFLCAVTCFLALLFWHDSTKAVASRIVYFFEDAFLSTTVFMPTVFLLHNAGERFKKSFLAWVMTACSAYTSSSRSFRCLQMCSITSRRTINSSAVRCLLWGYCLWQSSLFSTLSAPSKGGRNSRRSILPVFLSI